MTNRANFKAATNAYSRVWLIEGKARPDHEPGYRYAMVLGSPSQNFGDVTPIQVPHPQIPGDFIEIGVIRGEKERATVDVMGKYALDLEDELLRIARNRKQIDIQAHFGSCKRPDLFNGTWQKILCFTDVFPTNWSTDGDLGAMESGDQDTISSQSSLSALEMFEVMPLAFQEKASTVVTNEVIDVIIGDQLAVGGDCDVSDGCQRIYALSLAAGGSPSTPADVLVSADGGATWRAVDVDTLGAAEDPDALGWVGLYIVVVSADSLSQHYVLKDDLDDTTSDEAWTEVATGYVTAKGPRDISSAGSIAFVVGNGGYVYKISDPTAGVTVLDAGVAVSDDLLAVSALDEKFAVAVGNAGAIVKTSDGASWGALTRFVGVGVNLTSVQVIDENVWFVGTSGGQLYYTVDGGITWAEKTFPGSGSGVVRDISFSNYLIGYIAHDTSTPRGRILRTTDGGYSWYVLPEGAGTLAANDRITALTACQYDPNFVVGVGLADNATDGVIYIGEDKT